MLIFFATLGIVQVLGMHNAILIKDALGDVALIFVAIGVTILMSLRLRWRWRKAYPSTCPNAQSPKWDEKILFKCVGCESDQVSGYHYYTETFSAYGATLNYLRALADERSKIIYAGFALGYLTRKIGELDEANALLTDTNFLASEEVHPSSILGWLAGIHQSYPDKENADSRFVYSALRRVCTDYRKGRSFKLQFRYDALSVRTLVEGLDDERRQMRLRAHETLSDLPATQIRCLIDEAILAGRRFACRSKQEGPI